MPALEAPKTTRTHIRPPRPVPSNALHEGTPVNFMLLICPQATLIKLWHQVRSPRSCLLAINCSYDLIQSHLPSLPSSWGMFHAGISPKMTPARDSAIIHHQHCHVSTFTKLLQSLAKSLAATSICCQTLLPVFACDADHSDHNASQTWRLQLQCGITRTATSPLRRSGW